MTDHLPHDLGMSAMFSGTTPHRIKCERIAQPDGSFTLVIPAEALGAAMLDSGIAQMLADYKARVAALERRLNDPVAVRALFAKDCLPAMSEPLAEIFKRLRSLEKAEMARPTVPPPEPQPPADKPQCDHARAKTIVVNGRWTCICGATGDDDVERTDKPPVAQPGRDVLIRVATADDEYRCSDGYMTTVDELDISGKEKFKHMQEIMKERDDLKAKLAEAQKNYQFMVDRAAEQKLDGYRELGARAAEAENERDALKAELQKADSAISAAHYFNEQEDDLRKKLAEAEREREAMDRNLQIWVRSTKAAHARIEDIEKHLAEAEKRCDGYGAVCAEEEARANKAEADLAQAVAERDAAFASRTLHRRAAAGLSNEICALKEALRIAEESLRDMTLMRDNANKIWKEYLGKLEAAEKELEIVKDGREAYRSGIDKMHVRLDNMEVENSRLFAFWECFRLSDLHERVLILNGSGSAVGGTLVADKWVAAKANA